MYKNKEKYFTSPNEIRKTGKKAVVEYLNEYVNNDWIVNSDSGRVYTFPLNNALDEMEAFTLNYSQIHCKQHPDLIIKKISKRTFIIFSRRV